jgi:hypothetical protein
MGYLFGGGVIVVILICITIAWVCLGNRKVCRRSTSSTSSFSKSSSHHHVLQHHVDNANVEVVSGNGEANEVLATAAATEVVATDAATEVVATDAATEVVATDAATEVVATGAATEVVATDAIEFLPIGAATAATAVTQSVATGANELLATGVTITGVAKEWASASDAAAIVTLVDRGPLAYFDIANNKSTTSISSTSSSDNKGNEGKWWAAPSHLNLGTSKRPLFLPPAPEDIERVAREKPTKQFKVLSLGHSACDPAFEPVVKPLFSREKRRLFFGIGINYVSQPQNTLTSCWNDVETLHNELESRYGLFAGTWILTDRPANDHRAPSRLRPGVSNRAAGQLPTAPHFWALWGDIMREAVRDDADIVFVYSGHGSFRLTTDPYELYGQSDCMIFLDQFVWDFEIAERVVKAISPSAHMLMILDSCNSGSAANLPWTFNPLSRTVNQTSQHTSIIQNVVMFSGCRDEQTSAAGPTRNDLSQCTRVFIETLRGRTVGSVPVSELVGSMRRLLVASQDTQIPQLSMSRPPLLGALL